MANLTTKCGRDTQILSNVCQKIKEFVQLCKLQSGWNRDSNDQWCVLVDTMQGTAVKRLNCVHTDVHVITAYQ
jgi:hypothetical protein